MPPWPPASPCTPTRHQQLLCPPKSQKNPPGKPGNKEYLRNWLYGEAELRKNAKGKSLWKWEFNEFLIFWLNGWRWKQQGKDGLGKSVLKSGKNGIVWVGKGSPTTPSPARATTAPCPTTGFEIPPGMDIPSSFHGQLQLLAELSMKKKKGINPKNYKN